MAGEFLIKHGDCVEVLKSMRGESIDSIVTDPPYELGFMGKGWDESGIANSVDIWAEALRVLKPGGHLLAFGGTRTYHRMTCAIEDAGFEIRDSIDWIYGSGFPKSLDVSKAIDKQLGAERQPTGEVRTRHGGGEHSDKIQQLDPEAKATPVTAPGSLEAKKYAGWGTALKPAHEPIVLARKPLVGTVAANVLQHGTGGLNIDGCRVSFASVADREAAKPGGRATGKPLSRLAGVKDARAAFEASDNSRGRWPPNILLTHSADCNGDCAPGCPVAELDRQSGDKPRGGSIPPDGKGSGPRHNSILGKDNRPRGEFVAYPDSGGVSRFFPTFHWDEADFVPFLYCAKAAKRERNLGGIENKHPTVKPIKFMEWLCRLVTPPGGIVLDPFLGSGTTGIAALRCGFRFVGIEREAEYVKLAQQRIQAA